ncbi:MAG TPA: LysR substrate-binding domain-containing protein [Bordetella sp.]|nr:LysR substrate-binding domain-containing protein [Bordetella sp.]
MIPELTPFTAKALRRLRLRHLELLHHLGSVSTVRRAAELLSLSQPATTKMIQEIEDVCGTPLFLRGRRGIEPNAQGALLIRYASHVVHQIGNAGQQMQALEKGGSVLLKIGASSTMPLLARATARLRVQMPHLIMQVTDEPPRHFMARLMNGELDCALAPLPPETLASPDADKLQLTHICDDHLCVVASPTHRFAKKKGLAWGDLIAEPWVMSPPAALTRRTFIDICLQEQVTPPPPAIECVSFGSVRWLLHFDRSLLALMRYHQARAEAEAGLIAILPVKPVVQLPPISLITRRDTSAEPGIIDALLAALRHTD